MMLLPHHREELRASGISDKAIEEYEVYSIDRDPLAIQQALKWTRFNENYHTGLVFPYRRASDQRQSGFVRIKPDNPRKDSDERTKIIKYESPRKLIAPAFQPPNVYDIRWNSQNVDRLFLTEGEKKAMALYSYGFNVIGLPGAWGGISRRRNKQGEKIDGHKLKTDLGWISWEQYPVIIIMDSDAATNKHVWQAEEVLAEVLETWETEVKIVRLPPLIGGKKCGVDDFLEYRGIDALESLIRTAETLGVRRRRLGAAKQKREAELAFTFERGKIYVDIGDVRSPVEVATDLLMEKQVAAALIVVKSGHAARERAAELQELQVDAVAYPSFTEKNCRKMKSVQKATALGLIPSKSACAICEHRETWCQNSGYHSELAEAEKHDVGVVTQARAAGMYPTASIARDGIFVEQGSAVEIVWPMISFKRTCLDDLQKFFKLAIDHGFAMNADTKSMMFLMHALEFAEAIKIADWRSQALGKTVESKGGWVIPEVPYGLHKFLFKSIILGSLPAPPVDALRALFEVTVGRLTRIYADEDHIVGVIQGDGDASVFTIQELPIASYEMLSGSREVVQIDAPHEKGNVTHFRAKITKQSVPEATADIVRYIMASTGYQGVDIRCYEEHAVAIKGMHGEELARVASISCWGDAGRTTFGSDLILLIGTPRPNVQWIADNLFRVGKIIEGKADPEWNGKGYGHPDFQQMYTAMYRSEMHGFIHQKTPVHVFMVDGISAVQGKEAWDEDRGTEGWYPVSAEEMEVIREWRKAGEKPTVIDLAHKLSLPKSSVHDCLSRAREGGLI